MPTELLDQAAWPVSHSDSTDAHHSTGAPTTMLDELEAKRRAIIAASLDLGTEQGDEGVTMRGIATRVGVSPTALYQYFTSKADMLDAVAAEGDRRLRQALDEALGGAHGPSDALFRLSTRYIEFACRNPWLYSVMGRETAGDPSPLGRGGAAVFMTVAAPCFNGSDPLLADVDPRVAPLLVWVAVHGLASVLVGDRRSPRHLDLGGDGEGRMIESYVRVLIRGLWTATPERHAVEMIDDDRRTGTKVDHRVVTD